MNAWEEDCIYSSGLCDPRCGVLQDVQASPLEPMHGAPRLGPQPLAWLSYPKDAAFPCVRFQPWPGLIYHDDPSHRTGFDLLQSFTHRSENA